jgi:hypothetical protein
MRTVEALFVIIIILGAFIITAQFAVLPSPREAFGTNLRGLSQSTIETLDDKGMLTETIFKAPSDPAWGELQKALSASLPPNVVYNLSIYNISTSSGALSYQLMHSISDASIGADSDASSLLVTSPDVTFTQDPQKVGEGIGQNITLYILNCNDANGWWITGYTGQSLAADFQDLLSPYFTTTVLVNSTSDLEGLLNGNKLTAEDGENVENAVIVNTFGEAVPIPSDYCEFGARENEGYDGGTYALYFHTLGSLTRQYNWTWVSIVGYPFYYVTNTANFDTTQNGFGVYGMESVGPAGVNAFLQGLDNQVYNYNSYGTAAEVGVVQFTSEALDRLNYYGIYPPPYQTSSRALNQSIESNYNLDRFASVFETKNGRIAGATFRHQGGSGALTAMGLTRIPDIRVAALALLMYYQPTVYRSEFGATGTTRLVTLQLSQQGGT